MSKINQDFEFNYAAESAKLEFQQNISSLLELHAEFSARLQSAVDKHKDGVYILTGEMEVFKDWLMQTSTSLLENYALIDHTLRITNRLYKASTRIHLKDIAA